LIDDVSDIHFLVDFLFSPGHRSKTSCFHRFIPKIFTPS
jgi:hypothetical protein